MTKLLWRDMTSSNDDLPSYAQSIKLISTTAKWHWVNNKTTDFYPERVTLSKFIYEGRPTTTKSTFFALPYLTSNSTFHECSRGTPCQPQASLHKHLTKPVVIISYSIEHNKKVKLNNPTPYPSGSKTKPNPTLGKPTPTSNQVHQHSQDEPTEEPPSDSSTQTLVNQCLADSGIDPTDIQNVMSVSYANRNISSHESS